MTLVKDLKQLYLDTIQSELDNNSVANIKNCPTTNFKPYIESDGFTYKYENINTIIENIDYTGSDYAMPWYMIPGCSSSTNISGCCIKPTIRDPSNQIIDRCAPKETSTGIVYEYKNGLYNVCHNEDIQNKQSILSRLSDQQNGLKKFLMLFFVTIIIILLYTIFSLPYEFWLRYGNSIDCIYYKIGSKCKNKGPKLMDNNEKLNIIDYIFPTNLSNYPYEKCSNKPNKLNGGSIMKGGNKDEDKIISNYVEYNENGSKCINVDFGDYLDNEVSRPFPYNIGEYANSESMKSKYIAMILKGFSFYFLYTTLFIRIILNKGLSFISKIYQNKFEKYKLNSVLLLLNFIFTPFTIIGIIISLFFVIGTIFTQFIILMDIIKVLNIFKTDIKNTTSSEEKSDYYKIYKFENMFYPIFNRSEVNNESEVNMDIKTKLFLTIVGILLGMLLGLFTQWTPAIIILAIIVPITFLIIANSIYKNDTNFKIMVSRCYNTIKYILLDILLLIPYSISLISTYIFGIFGGMLASLYMALSTLFYFYYVTYSNSMEFLDLLKDHSKLLTILLLLSIISSSAIGLNSQVTGILGCLFGIYIIYELYKLFN